MKIFIICLFVLLCSYVLHGQSILNTNGLSYDGGDYIKIDETDFRKSDNAGTILCWMYVTDASATGYTFIFSDNVSTQRFLAGGVFDDAGTPRFVLVWRNSATINRMLSTTEVLENQWYCVMFMSDGSSYDIYVNGEQETLLINSGTDDGSWLDDILIVTLDHFALGAFYRDSPASYFNGSIDEVAYFNAEKSSSASTYYNNGYPYDLTSEANLTDWWRFEEGTGTTSSATVGTMDITEFGDGSTSTTYPTWTSDVPSDVMGRDKAFKAWKNRWKSYGKKY